MKKIQENVRTILFDEYLILGLNKKWIGVFNEMPMFDVMLDKQGRLVLKSTKSISYTKSIK